MNLLQALMKTGCKPGTYIPNRDDKDPDTDKAVARRLTFADKTPKRMAAQISPAESPPLKKSKKNKHHVTRTVLGLKFGTITVAKNFRCKPT